MRFWAASSKLGNDLDYQEKDLIAGKKLINKLLNATKFVFMNLKNFDFKKPKNLQNLDEIFLGELNELIKNSTKNFEGFEYSKVKTDVEKFFWEEFTGNYLEIVKGRIYRGNEEEKKSAQYVLYKSLLEILKIFAPLMPFITEEIYQEFFKKNETEKSIHTSSWPVAEKETPSENWKMFTEILAKVRQEKSLAKKPMNSQIKLELLEKDYDILKKDNLLNDLENVTNALQGQIVPAKKSQIKFF